jgi:xanthine dehydrogenase YagT iron-sulfur-binding subunit
MTERQAFTRRKFLTGVGAGALVAGALPGIARDAHARPKQQPGPTLGPGPVPIVLRVNGEERSLEVEPRVTLLDALRNRLDLTGAKKVCDRATCGACTVLQDGKAVYSCTVLAIAAQGREITTIEGIGSPSELAPIQQAFVDADAQQCGFCTPGFVMASEALLRRAPGTAPTAAQVHEAVAGNLCRCGTYMGVRSACMGTREPAKGGG